MAHSYQNQSRNATPTSELAHMQLNESRDASPAMTTRSKRDHESVESSPTAPAQSEKERRVDYSAAVSATNWDAQPDQREPSRKHSTRSKLDALSKERETAARQVTIREPNDVKDGTSNVIKATALEAWRKSRSAFANAQRAKLRKTHIDQLAEERLYPEWAFTKSGTPPYLLPLEEHKKQFAQLTMDQAHAKLCFISECLSTYGKSETNTGAHLENSVREQYAPHEEEQFFEGQAKLIAMVERDTKLLETRLNKTLNYWRANHIRVQTLSEHLFGGRNRDQAPSRRDNNKPRQQSRNSRNPSTQRNAPSSGNKRRRSNSRENSYTTRGRNEREGREGRPRNTRPQTQNPRRRNDQRENNRSGKSYSLTPRELAILDTLRNK